MKIVIINGSARKGNVITQMQEMNLQKMQMQFRSWRIWEKMYNTKKSIAYYHLPGLFEFYELYCEFLPLFRKHREYFYDWCEIGSIYGAPADCIWGGGRAGFGEQEPEEVLELMQEYGISARLTFSNSLIEKNIWQIKSVMNFVHYLKKMWKIKRIK